MMTHRLELKSAAEIAASVEQLTRGVGATRYADRRAEPRFAVDLPAEVRPVDEHLEPCGTGFEARMRDISTSGIRLTHSEPVQHRFLAVSVQSDGGAESTAVELVMEVLWCRRCGDHYDLGGRLLASRSCPG